MSEAATLELPGELKDLGDKDSRETAGKALIRAEADKRKDVSDAAKKGLPDVGSADELKAWRAAVEKEDKDKK